MSTEAKTPCKAHSQLNGGTLSQYQTWCPSCRTADAAVSKPRTVKIRVVVTIEIDVDDYQLNYGTDSIEQIREDVKIGVLSAVGPEGGLLAAGIVNAELQN